MHVSNVTVIEAFRTALARTGLVAQIRPEGDVAIVRDAGNAAVARSGIVIGHVLNAKTQAPMRGVTVVLDDSGITTRTNEKGEYRFVGVAAGPHRVATRFVGYTRQIKAITVTDDQTVTLDFVLDASVVNTLDQVVVTATGEQRIRELGHVVATINADSLVKRAPITELSDLLQARVPGLQVMSGAGSYAGGTVTLQLRGTSSMALQSSPIVIVDGVRYQSDNSLSNSLNNQDTRGVTYQQRSPLNDLNPNDIETVEVVKGPSASTLYGPDAANGVIVITTKRGNVGAPRFAWYARPVSNTTREPEYVTKSYTVWSHDPSTNALITYPCTLIRQYIDQSCILDSITVATTTMQVDSLSPVAQNRPTWQYGANLSGGTPIARYFVSGNYVNQVGTLRIPPALLHLMQDQLGENAITGLHRNPNTLTTIGTQASVSSDVSSWFGLTGSVSYTHTNNNRSATPSVYTNALLTTGLAFADSSTIASHVRDDIYPFRVALETSVEETNRFVTSLTGQFHPASWLGMTALFGTDLNGIHAHTERPGGLADQYDGGEVVEDYRSMVNRTMGLNATVNLHPGLFSFRTTGGVQYIYHRFDGTTASGTDLPQGSVNMYLAQSKYLMPVWDENVQLGGYGEEVVGINDRVYLSAAMRLDGSATFGDSYHPTPFPKLGVSWIASEEPFLRNLPGLRELRFRYSYGSATRHPTSSMKLGQLNGLNMTLNNTTMTYYWPQYFASADLKPERSNEHEWGADATILNGTTVQLTWWRRKVIDELLQRNGNPVGFNYYWMNGGTVGKHGFEATVNVPVFATQRAQGDIAFNYAYNTSTLLRLPEGRLNNAASIGYPLDAVFGQPIIAVLDTSGGHPDSVVTSDEIVRSPGYVFYGVTSPPRTYSITPSVTLFNGIVQISSLFDHASDFITTDDYGNQCRYTASCLAPFSKTAPLMEQARYVEGNRDNDFNLKTHYTRWRELTVRASVPQSIMRRFNIVGFQLINGASVSLQGRNLLLWTNFTGTDPESRTDRDPSTSNITNGMPQARSWALRFDITP